jgi:hypothetical protein
MAITYTYTQSPDDVSPVATGSFTGGATTDVAYVELGFVPSAVKIIIKDASNVDEVIFWANCMGTDAVISGGAGDLVITSGIAAYAGSATVKAGFSVDVSEVGTNDITASDVIYWIAWR